MPYANVVKRLYIEDGLDRREVPVNGLRLQWSKGDAGHVQIASCEMTNGMPEGEYLDSHAARWAGLDRYTINQLIRELRQARDDAFGKDA